MPRKVLFLVNPVSGTTDKSRLNEYLLQQTAAKQIAAEVHPSDPNGRYEEIARKILEEQFTDIVIGGGDGTINEVVGQLRHLPVRFGILPLGSGNGLAFAAGIPGNTGKALSVFFQGRTKMIDAFLINEQFGCMLCGLGLDAAVAHQFAAQPQRGLRTYTWLTAKSFFQAKPFPFQISANGYSFPTEAFLVAVANSNQFGNHVTIAPKAELNDGLLDVVILKKGAKLRLLFSVIRQLLAGKVQDIENSLRLPILYFQTDRLTISNPGAAPLHIDGEARSTGPQIDIQVIPSCFALIC